MKSTSGEGDWLGAVATRRNRRKRKDGENGEKEKAGEEISRGERGRQLETPVRIVLSQSRSSRPAERELRARGPLLEVA